MTAAGEQAHPAAFQARHEAITVVLDLVQPAWAGWWHAGGGRNAGFDEAWGSRSDTR
jgi:hypothetical protein